MSIRMIRLVVLLGAAALGLWDIGAITTGMGSPVPPVLAASR